MLKNKYAKELPKEKLKSLLEKLIQEIGPIHKIKLKTIIKFAYIHKNSYIEINLNERQIGAYQIDQNSNYKAIFLNIDKLRNILVILEKYDF